MFRFAFQFSVYRVRTLFYSLVCIFRLLIISEYLLKIKIFMAFIRSNVFVEKLTKVLKDKHFPLTFECLILIRWISFTHFRQRQLYWDPKIVIMQDTWSKFSSHKTTQRSLEFCLASVLYSLTLKKRKKFQGLGTVWPPVVFEPWE